MRHVTNKVSVKGVLFCLVFTRARPVLYECALDKDLSLFEVSILVTEGT